MKRKEAEERILAKLEEIAETVREYGAPSGYLAVSIYTNEGYISFNNKSWDGGDDEKAGRAIFYSTAMADRAEGGDE